jgi:uncharacterized OB-fold protein
MEVPRNWRIRKERYSLQGSVCTHCGEPNFPVRVVCPHCGGVQGQEFFMGQQEEALPLAIEVARPVALRSRGG